MNKGSKTLGATSRKSVIGFDAFPLSIFAVLETVSTETLVRASVTVCDPPSALPNVGRREHYGRLRDLRSSGTTRFVAGEYESGVAPHR